MKRRFALALTVFLQEGLEEETEKLHLHLLYFLRKRGLGGRHEEIAHVLAVFLQEKSLEEEMKNCTYFCNKRGFVSFIGEEDYSCWQKISGRKGESLLLVQVKKIHSGRRPSKRKITSPGITHFILTEQHLFPR